MITCLSKKENGGGYENQEIRSLLKWIIEECEKEQSLNNNISKICKCKKIEEIAEYRRGSFPQPYTNQTFYGGEGSMPFVQVADLYDDKYVLKEITKNTISKIAQPMSIFVEKGKVLLTLQGTIGRVAINQYDCYVDRTLAIFSNFKFNINKKFFCYILKSIFEEKKKYARGSTIKTITKEEFSEFNVYIPNIVAQEKIVSVLDRFDKLCNDLTEGLPAEIEARKKQYEYYRDKLLTF